MPKLKTHKGARRRFQVTGSGKIMRSKIGKSHLRRNKPSRVKRQYNGKIEVNPSFRTQVKHLLPYG
jgi:large subunit ribosomal protein L35